MYDYKKESRFCVFVFLRPPWMISKEEMKIKTISGLHEYCFSHPNLFYTVVRINKQHDVRNIYSVFFKCGVNYTDITEKEFGNDVLPSETHVYIRIIDDHNSPTSPIYSISIEVKTPLCVF